MKKITFFLSLFLVVPFSLYAKEIPDSLDFYKRDARPTQWELFPYGGEYFGDKLQHSFVVGGNIQKNFTPGFGVSADFGYSKASVDSSSALGAIFTNDNEYLIDGGIVLIQPSVFRSGGSAVEADLFTSLGMGMIRLNNSNRLSGYLGGGMTVRIPIQWLAIRVEIRNYFTSVDNPNGTDFEDELTLRIGPVFLLGRKKEQ